MNSARNLWLAAAAMSLAGLSTAQAQAQPDAQGSDTASSRQLTLWLETFNSADREMLEEFNREHWPSKSPQSVDQDLAFHGRTGGFDLLRIEEATATRTVALVKERNSDTVARVTFVVAAEPPHHVASLGARVIQTPAEYTVPRLSEAALVDALGVEIDRRAELGQFSGAVLLAKDGQSIFAEAYGLADRERGVPNTLQTQFRNGSMNKMFTATAVLTLAQAGKLSLDAPMGTYLTDYPNEALASTVTIHDLLTHTGGTGDIFGPEFAANRLDLRTHQDYLDLFGERAALFGSGARYQYSNYGFVLLGAVIERVSGQNYYDYVREHIYEPAGMTSTGSAPEEESVPGRSVGYMWSSDGAVPNTGTLPYRGMAAGGGYTTVEDLLRFASALTNHRLLDAEYTALATTGKVDAGGARYAYGFSESTSTGGLRWIGHGGGAPGMNGDLLIFDSGYVIAVLANMDPPAATSIANFAANRLPLP